MTASAVPLGSGPGVRTRTRPVLILLAGMVGLVLLIACANIAGLLLTRAVARRRDVAIRMAVGAGRGQLVRQWLTEAVLLGLLGAGAGLLVVRWATPLLNGLAIPEAIDLTVNPRVLAFTPLVGVSSGIVFGLAPAMQLARRDVLSALRDEGGVVATGARATRLRSGFVVLQVALSLVRLVGAGLFGRTLLHAYAVDLGYSVDRMLVVDLSLGELHSPESGQALYDAVLERVGALPGVVAAGAARVVVLSGGWRTVGVSTDGRPIRIDRSNAIPARTNVVSRDYLDVMGIPIVRGRPFEAQDLPTSPRVAIISRALGEQLWPGAVPIGQRLVMDDAEFQVIGVVPDTVYLRSTELEPLPFFYQLLSQNYENGVSLHIRTSVDPMTVLGPVRQAVRALDPRLALTRPRRLADEFDRSVETERMLARLTGLMSGSALLLAALGLYGVMSYMVRQRTAEVGIRMALGATPGAIMQQIVGRGVSLVAIGVALGLAGAFAGVRLVRNQLFGVEPTDPITWIGVGVLLSTVALLACAIPARRAMLVSPASVLRSH